MRALPPRLPFVTEGKFSRRGHLPVRRDCQPRVLHSQIVTLPQASLAQRRTDFF